MPDFLQTVPAGDDAAEAIRNACVEEAIRAYGDAGISGLCHEGRFEAAVSAMRLLDLDRVPRAAGSA